MEVAIYGVMFTGATFFVELATGVKALQALDKNYPFDDKVLAPSIGYLIRLFKHKVRKMEVLPGWTPRDSEPFQNDPSVEDDTEIDEFFSVTAF